MKYKSLLFVSLLLIKPIHGSDLKGFLDFAAYRIRELGITVSIDTINLYKQQLRVNKQEQETFFSFTLPSNQAELLKCKEDELKKLLIHTEDIFILNTMMMVHEYNKKLLEVLVETRKPYLQEYKEVYGCEHGQGGHAFNQFNAIHTGHSPKKEDAEKNKEEKLVKMANQNSLLPVYLVDKKLEEPWKLQFVRPNRTTPINICPWKKKPKISIEFDDDW